MFRAPNRGERLCRGGTRQAGRYPSGHPTSSAKIVEVFLVCREVGWSFVEHPAPFLHQIVQRPRPGLSWQLRLALTRRLFVFEHETQALRDEVLQLAPAQ